jgi:hypothetical protein
MPAARIARDLENTAFPAAGTEWWAQLMGRTPLSSQLGFIPMVPGSHAGRG